MKTLALFMAIVSMLNLSCKDEKVTIDDSLKCPVKAFAGNQNKIIGKWKLVQWSFPFNPTSNKIDYSCNEIVYDFSSNGTLKVAGDLQDRYGLADGSYPFEFKMSNDKPDLKIDGKLYGDGYIITIAPTMMIWNNSPLDGYIYTFIRIN